MHGLFGMCNSACSSSTDCQAPRKHCTMRGPSCNSRAGADCGFNQSVLNCDSASLFRIVDSDSLLCQALVLGHELPGSFPRARARARARTITGIQLLHSAHRACAHRHTGPHDQQPGCTCSRANANRQARPSRRAAPRIRSVAKHGQPAGAATPSISYQDGKHKVQIEWLNLHR